MQVRAYHIDDAPSWDAFCEQALNATFLHTRRYLSYHGDRFMDTSLVVEDEKGRWVGALPAARAPDDATCVVSHPGLTYGGLLHTGRLTGSRSVDAFDAVCAHYRGVGFGRLLYKAVPDIYHRAPAQEDLYALFRLGARRCRTDLSATIRIDHRLTTNERRRRALKKAERAGVTLQEDNAFLEPLWGVLRDNLARRHGAAPVHDEREIRLLAEKFPERVRCLTGWLGDELVAGIVIFVAGPVHHAQYIASNENGQSVNALDSVFERAIEAAAYSGANWFDFGISTEADGWYLNDGLHTFKSEFGSGSTVQESYEIDLRRKDP